MILLASLLFSGALLALAAGLGMITLPDRLVRTRVRALAPAPLEHSVSDEEEPDRSPTLLNRLTPEGMLAKIERNMVLAGRPEGWSREKVILAKPAGLIFGMFFAIVIIAKTTSPFLVLFALGVVVLGYIVPDLLIYNMAIKRQEDIQKDLPDTLDQIVISIEAGLGFEAALNKAAEKGEGPLAEELTRLIQDIALGMPRRDAYQALADRTTVEDLNNFAKAIVQAEKYGVSISSVVRTQAKEMRISRRSRAEAKAQQVPVKILLPLMLCILPVLFVIVLGPAVVSAFAQT